MKNTFLILSIFSIMFSCKAQITGTLEQFEECRKRPNRGLEGCPDLENITYVKDTNNRLNEFIGTWKGTYNGKNYEIKFEKKLKFGNNQTKWDKLIGRMVVKDIQGNIIYNNLSEPDEDIRFWGVNFQGSAYEMNFIGNYDCTESGKVIIEKKLNNPNEMTLFYFNDSDVTLNPAKCPNYSTFVFLFPLQKMTLVKQ